MSVGVSLFGELGGDMVLRRREICELGIDAGLTTVLDDGQQDLGRWPAGLTPARGSRPG